MGAKHFICWGVHAVRSALTNAATDGLEMWLRDGGLSADLQELAELGRARGITVQQAPAKTLVRLTEGAVHQGIVLRRRFPRPLALDDYLAGIPSSPAKPLLLALDQVTDPQNFGACLRVADGAGADAVIVPRDHTAALTGHVAKAASGALDTVSIISVPNLARSLDALRDAGIWLVGATHDGEQRFFDCDLSAPTGLVFGAEGAGLRALTRKKCDLLARIPMAGSVASLNVSTAVAIGLFEAVRQRGGEA
tara:strand:+ start:12707 stop:13459 length:753 start_codon:yes stop_codon:yes gene_type:complete